MCVYGRAVWRVRRGLVTPFAVCDFASLADMLRKADFVVAFGEHDGQDPLGDVIDVSGPFGLVQTVNLGERFPGVGLPSLPKRDTKESSRFRRLFPRWKNVAVPRCHRFG